MVLEGRRVRRPAALHRRRDVDQARAVARGEQALLAERPVQRVALRAVAFELVDGVGGQGGKRDRRRGGRAGGGRGGLLDLGELRRDVVDAHNARFGPDAHDLRSVRQTLREKREREKDYADAVHGAAVRDGGHGDYGVGFIVRLFGRIVVVFGLAQTGDLGHHDLVVRTAFCLSARDQIQRVRVLLWRETRTITRRRIAPRLS